MCGRTSLFQPQSEIERRFSGNVPSDWTPSYNIAPEDDLLTVQSEEAEEMSLLTWGLRPHWVDDPDDWGHPINARAETVSEKPAFRDAFENRRCLVAADGFYEWKGERGHKQPYRIERADDELFSFAGLWESWSKNGENVETVTIITTEPNDVVGSIHDRMPVMLEADQESTWLESDDQGELLELLDPYPDDLTEAYPISKRVNNPDNDSADILEPIDIGDQAGLEEFG